MEFISCTYNVNGTAYVDATLGQESGGLVCWGPLHRPFAAIAIYSVTAFIITSTILAPFYSEAMDGNTQLVFPALYSLIQRNLNLVIVLVATFFSKAINTIILTTITISLFDIYLLLRWEPAPVKWLNVVNIMIRVILIWSAGISLSAGRLPRPDNAGTHFNVMLGGDGIILIVGVFMCCKNSARNKNTGDEWEGTLITAERFQPFFVRYNLNLSDKVKDMPKQICHFCVAHTISRNLEFSYASIDDQCAIKIGYGLQHNKSLTDLSLCRNKIRSAGAKGISNGLKFNTALRCLNLDQNEVNKEGAVYISKALLHNKTLKELKLGENNIGDGGAVSLAKCLKKNFTLQKLHIYSNFIGDIGAIEICNALNQNNTLLELDISGNVIEEEGAKKLGKILKENKALQNVMLQSNKFSPDTLEILNSILQEKELLRQKTMSKNMGHLLDSQIDLVNKL